MDLSKLCRLCAKEDRLCIEVFGEEGIKQNVAKKIRFCLPIVVKESDDSPKQICLNCLSNLDTSYELYTRCLEAQSVIKNLMLVNVQSSGDLVKVYSTQELIKMMNELRDKMCEKRPAVRLGNTFYTIQDAGNETEASNNDEHRAKKRKQEEAAKSSSRSMVYPMGPLGQQIMLMPSVTMPQAVMIPSGVPHGQFTIAPMPTFPMPAMQAVTTAPAVATTTTNNQTLTQAGTVATKDAAVKPISTAKITPNSAELTAQPQITSIQTAIQAFQNSSLPRIASVQPIMSSAPVISVGIAPSSSATEPQAFQPIQSSTPMGRNQATSNEEDTPTEILPLTSSDNTPAAAPPVITKRSPRSSPTPESLSRKSRASSFLVNMGGGDTDDDDDYAADDPDPLQDNSDEEEEEEEEEEVATEIRDRTKKTADTAPGVRKSATQAVRKQPVVADTSRKDEGVDTVQELSSDESVPDAPADGQLCPYCKKYFPDDVIYHHKKLHFREKFFSCVSCNKNFRTEAGLETHRCE